MDQDFYPVSRSKIVQIAIWIEKFCPVSTLDLDHDRNLDCNQERDLDNFCSVLTGYFYTQKPL